MSKSKPKINSVAVLKHLLKYRSERDRAVGAVLLLLMVHDGVISQGRARELLGMDIMQQRAEFRRIAKGYRS